MSGEHGFFCNCKRCNKKYSQIGSTLPSSDRGRRERPDRDRSRSRGGGRHKGGFGTPVHGWIDGRPVTAAFGWGTKEGHTLLADGHVDLTTFRDHHNHNHYGPGDGQNQNVKDRFRYTGPGA